MSTHTKTGASVKSIVYDSPKEPFIGEYVRFQTASGAVVGEVEKAVQTTDAVTLHVMTESDGLTHVDWADVERADSAGQFECMHCGGRTFTPIVCSDCKSESSSGNSSRRGNR